MMPDSLRPNLTLRRLMGEYGFTREGLAEAVNDATLRLTDVPGKCTARLVGLWLRGDVTWPREHSRVPLEAVFGCSAIDLGFRPPLSSAARATVRRSVRRPYGEPPVQRRKFVLGFGSLLALPPLPESGRLGMSDVTRIRQAEVRLGRLDHQQGGGQLAAIASRYIEHAESAVRDCTCASRVRNELNRALGEMHARAGWLAYDARQGKQARYHFDSGLRYALLARDPMLQARIWANISRQAADSGHGGEAVAIARAALDATRNHRNPRLSAVLHARVALGHSVEGDGGRAGQSLHRAEQQLDHASNDDPAWLRFCGPDELAGLAALCYYNLGDYKAAAHHDRNSLTLTDHDEFKRNDFAGHVNLARSLLAAGEVDGALASGNNALHLLPDVRSPRWTAHLSAFQNTAARVAPRETREFTERYRAATK